MWRQTLARGGLFPLSADYSVVMCGGWRNLSDLTLASSQYDRLLCTETFFSDTRHVSELLVLGFGRPVLLCGGRLPRARGMEAYVRDACGAFRQPKFECAMVAAKCWILEFVV